MALVCDTSILVAAFDRSDPDHRRCAALLETTADDLLLPTLTLVELDYWCRKRELRRSWPGLLDELEAGVWRLMHPNGTDLRRSRELLKQYADLNLSLVDATVIALCERLEEPKIATLDRRHFSVVRPAHVEALRLLPE